MKRCPQCNTENQGHYLFCQNCGRRLDEASSQAPRSTASLQATGMINMPGDAPATACSAYLEFLGGPEDGRVTLLSGERLTVGRRQDNDVHIYSDAALSRQHAFIYRKNGRFWIEDRKSSFGTWVDGERVPVNTSAPLRDGSLIRLARTQMLFYRGEPKTVVLQQMTEQASKL